jgi:hypothetical protein
MAVMAQAVREDHVGKEHYPPTWYRPKYTESKVAPNNLLLTAMIALIGILPFISSHLPIGFRQYLSMLFR